VTELVIGGLSLAAAGFAAAAFAKPLATSQERIVRMLPGPLERFYRIIGAGAPFDAPPWVAHNRVAGLLIMLFGTMVAAVAALRP
jgi:hypothetical protein